MLRLFDHLRRAALASFGHSAFSTAKAAAYSAVFSLFPALLVVTTLLAITPEGGSFSGEIRAAFAQVLPPDTMYLVQAYFQINHTRSVHLIWSASFVTVAASMGFMLSLMEGFRRAYGLQRNVWSFWRERVVAFLLLPGTLIPMVFATLLVAFGHTIERWMVENADHVLRMYVLLVWRIIRWTIATCTSVAVLTVLYHFGVPHRRNWRTVLPGAALGTVTWFLVTLAYGWYVTRFSDYSLVYGSFGAGVATLIWLYMVSISILIGSEFNAQLFPLPGTLTRKPEHESAPVNPQTV
ncbi:YihY/virulence factor BrkB family protein [Paracidobacterium acidisoli]|uniref:YihY/virulence factor BrkB family protein n=1 Tax=Paracidobacterium acidisoli TaxID=2303751 RepID=A0A372INJ4_9BACT|nr:YihY/virulence factor BrkB family protein [Paracidobacterium acidisoli]MBT9332161.1 YihY/virulence factor BrkB family protein [Paracidobacterium acidisoli]